MRFINTVKNKLGIRAQFYVETNSAELTKELLSYVKTLRLMLLIFTGIGVGTSVFCILFFEWPRGVPLFLVAIACAFCTLNKMTKLRNIQNSLEL